MKSKVVFRKTPLAANHYRVVELTNRSEPEVDSVMTKQQLDAFIESYSHVPAANAVTIVVKEATKL